MKKKSTLTDVTALLTANSVLFASCTNGQLLNTEVDPTFDENLYAANQEQYKSPFFVDHIIKTSEQTHLKALAKLTTDLFDNQTLANALKKEPKKILDKYGIHENLLPTESIEFKIILTLADPVAVDLLKKADMLAYSSYLQAQGLIASELQRTDIKKTLESFNTLGGGNIEMFHNREAMWAFGAGIVAVAAAIAVAITTAVVYTSVAFWGKASGAAPSSNVDKLSSDIAKSLVNIGAIEEDDVSSMTGIIEDSIIDAISE